MYAGYFNLNTWLRRFVRSDLVDDYEKRCRDIVNKYQGMNTENCLINMISELNTALYNLAIEALWEKKKWIEENMTDDEIISTEDATIKYINTEGDH